MRMQCGKHVDASLMATEVLKSKCVQEQMGEDSAEECADPENSFRRALTTFIFFFSHQRNSDHRLMDLPPETLL